MTATPQAMTIATVDVTTVDRGSFFGREIRQTFSFNTEEFSYPPELDDYIALALCGKKYISIVFHTEETAMVSASANGVLAKVSGYSGAINA